MFPRIFSFLRKLIGLGRKLFDHIVDHDELLKIGIFRLVWRSREEELGNYIELLVRMPDIELLLACESDTQEAVTRVGGEINVLSFLAHDKNVDASRN